MLEYAGLSSRHADRQRLAVCHAKLDDIGAVALGAVNHDAVLAARRSHAHRRRSFDESSSASGFTAGASDDVAELRGLGCWASGRGSTKIGAVPVFAPRVFPARDEPLGTSATIDPLKRRLLALRCCSSVT